MLPSPTPEATRFTLPRRTSPAAKMPGTLVSSRKIGHVAARCRSGPATSAEATFDRGGGPR
jgi:hypothetical protein